MKIKHIGKFLDQPLLISKFQEKVPFLLTIGGSGAIIHSGKDKKETQKKTYTQHTFAMAGAVASALLAPKITAKIFKESADEFNKTKIITRNKRIINKFLKENKLNEEVREILNTAKTKILSPAKTNILFSEIQDDKFLNKLIPAPENVKAKDIFSEMGRLSVFGFIPVAGGIGGGILGDYLTEDKWKDKVPNKVKEGAYQYLANIFLCNVGAAVALLAMEKANVQSKSIRALAMVGGIVLTGVVLGSKIANVIGNKIINPLFNKNKAMQKEERTPEALDICLHTDDVATVMVMSGLKWIEPALPILYAVSGYRAGIGYRNHNHLHGSLENKPKTTARV